MFFRVWYFWGLVFILGLCFMSLQKLVWNLLLLLSCLENEKLLMFLVVVVVFGVALDV